LRDAVWTLDPNRNSNPHRIVSVWNSLPDSVVSAASVNSFKSSLDKFWSMHDFVYDYRVEMHIRRPLQTQQNLP